MNIEEQAKIVRALGYTEYSQPQPYEVAENHARLVEIAKRGERVRLLGILTGIALGIFILLQITGCVPTDAKWVSGAPSGNRGGK